MTWTVLDLKRIPPTTRCCQHCNPELIDAYSASTVHDERIKKFAPDFLFPIVPPHSRPSSSLSIRSAISNSSTFVPISSGYKVPLDEKERLRSQLIQWREKMHVLRGSPMFFSSQIFLPPKQLNLLVSECNKYLEVPIVDARFLRKLVQWDSAGEAEWDEVSQLIMEWREDARPPATTPTSQRRARKKTRAQVEAPRTPVVQPNFQALHAAPRFVPARQWFPGPASDVFQTPQPTTGAQVEAPRTPVAQPNFQALHAAPPASRFTPAQQWFPASNVFQTRQPTRQPTTGQPYISQTPMTTPRQRLPTEPILSPSNIQTNPYYQLISPRPAVYPQTPILPYNQSPPGTIIYQTPTAPPSSLRFSYYNCQMPQ
jgi:hypothetical protein